MFKSEFLFDKKMRDLGYDYEWVFPKKNHSYGYDVIVNGHRVEVKEITHIYRQRKTYKGKQYVYLSVRANCHKHGIKENNVDLYAVLINEDFYLIPASFITGKTLYVNTNNINPKLNHFKEKWGLLKDK